MPLRYICIRKYFVSLETLVSCVVGRYDVAGGSNCTAAVAAIDGADKNVAVRLAVTSVCGHALLHIGFLAILSVLEHPRSPLASHTTSNND
jgi:hypothetical protein